MYIALQVPSKMAWHDLVEYAFEDCMTMFDLYAAVCDHGACISLG